MTKNRRYKRFFQCLFLWRKTNRQLFVCLLFRNKNAVIAPIVDDRFNAKKICGKNFEKWQDSYAMYMSVFGLKRGIPKKITKRKHTTLKEYNEQLKKENDILEAEKSKNEKRVKELIDERKHLADDILNDDFSEFYNNKGGHER